MLKPLIAVYAVLVIAALWGTQNNIGLAIVAALLSLPVAAVIYVKLGVKR